jgi:hypothetical protein
MRESGLDHPILATLPGLLAASALAKMQQLHDSAQRPTGNIAAR